MITNFYFDFIEGLRNIGDMYFSMGLLRYHPKLYEGPHPGVQIGAYTLVGH